MKKKILYWLLIILLAALSFSSLNSARDDLPNARGAGQQVVGYAGLACGIAGLATIAGLARHRRWSLHAMMACGLACVVAAMTATRYYGEAPLSASLAAGASTLLVVGLVYLGISKVLS